MADLVYLNDHLLPVIHRLGIRLGFRSKTIQQVCNEYGVDPAFFLCIINTFNEKGFFPEERLMSFSLGLLIDYLKKTHNYYRETALPKIEALLNEFLKSIPGEPQELEVIKGLYIDYRQKLFEHIAYEEEKLFPYLCRLFAQDGNIVHEQIREGFEHEHETVDLEVDDLKNIIIRHLSADYNKAVCEDLLVEISRFERDITNHSRVEDLILASQIERLEKGRYHAK